MDKRLLDIAVEKLKQDTAENLTEIRDTLNHGQRKQLAKNAKIVEFFARYGVELEETK